MEGVDREVLVAAEPGEVWEAISSPDRLADWFGADVEGDLAEGEPVRFVWPDGNARRAVVERVEPGRRLAFRWLPSLREPSSRVEITIDEAEGGSIVHVVERRIEAAVSPSPRIGFRSLARV